MKEVLSEIEVWKARGDRIALATVIDVQRSAPRPPGAKMAVNEHGEIAGSVSGGCVEGAVAEIADEILRGEPPQLVHFGIADSDAWDVGLPCGGEIDVWVQAYEPGRFEEIARCRRPGRRGDACWRAPRPGPSCSSRPTAPGRASLGAPELDDEAARVAVEQLWAETSERRDGLFIDVVGPAPRLIVFGAVDIAASLCTLARRRRMASLRRRPARPVRHSGAVPRCRGGDRGVARGGGRADRRDRSGHLDRGADPRPEARRCGARARAELAGAVHRSDGVAPRAGQAARAAARAGTRRERARAHIRAGRPRPRRRSAAEETALSILAEIVAARHGRDGGRLAERKGRIHEVPA